jgi:hypothetical protein
MRSVAANILSHDGDKPRFRKAELSVNQRWSSTRQRVRSHLFRAWTALFILAGYVYGWLYRPETLTWWKRATTSVIEAGCDLLPYPWGDRIEATIGNFGLWVQITLAIIAFRILIWLVMAVVRLSFTPRR